MRSTCSIPDTSPQVLPQSRVQGRYLLARYRSTLINFLRQIYWFCPSAPSKPALSASLPTDNYYYPPYLPTTPTTTYYCCYCYYYLLLLPPLLPLLLLHYCLGLNSFPLPRLLCSALLCSALPCSAFCPILLVNSLTQISHHANICCDSTQKIILLILKLTRSCE